MSTALQTRLDRIIEKAAPTMPADLSQLDRWDGLGVTTNTAAVPVIASRRPVAAVPRTSAPVPYQPEQFGAMPSILPPRRAPWADLGLLIPVGMIVGSILAVVAL
jgi:hypothetical protein